MHAPAPLTTAALSMLLSSTAAAASSNPLPQKLGLIGPENMMLFLNGFHFISGAPNHYLQANHHCVLMSADFIQCAIYVPGSNPARLAGVEYIVSGDAFAELDHQERQLWHSHQYEVTSGYLTEPGLPQSVDDEVMKILVNSYGKVCSPESSLPLSPFSLFLIVMSMTDLPHLALRPEKQYAPARHPGDRQRLHAGRPADAGVRRRARRVFWHQ